MNLTIIGAGLAGCLAGALEPSATIYERESEHTLVEHRAVLRFRDNRIAEALGIPFKRVTVHKAVWDGARCQQWASPAQMNAYAMKVTGRLADRSIADLSTCTRFVGPTDLHAILADLCRGRIRWSRPVTTIARDLISFYGEGSRERKEPLISTMPVGRLLQILDPTPEFGPEVLDLHAQSIHIERLTILDADVHQTIYFPDPATPIYRATITGDQLIVEAMREPTPVQRLAIVQAFGLGQEHCRTAWTAQSQRFGKIVPWPAEVRKRTLLALTMRYGIYSLGRFACWRNVLLDDVYLDLFKIRSMIKMGTYDLIRAVNGDSK